MKVHMGLKGDDLVKSRFNCLIVCPVNPAAIKC